MKTKLALALAVLALTGVTASAADVKANWEKHCAKCHGTDGKGDTKLGKKSEVKDMTTVQYQAELKEDKAFKSVKEGIKEGEKIRMKPAEGLSDDEIKALVAHVRTFKK
jgi:cytochrome c553